ncbi:MAG: DUF86 domain-containing protein [Spirochaetota bacterium]
MRDESLYLKDILEAIHSIERFIGEMSFDEFVADDKTNSAVARKFEIIGEASKNISEKTKIENPDIPWKEMAGMRDKLIHAYFGISHKILWNTIIHFFPKIKNRLNQIL